MAAPIMLRHDFTAAQLRQQARRSHDAGQARRLLALATIYDGIHPVSTAGMISGL